MEKIKIIKIGGGIIDDNTKLNLFLQDFAKLEGLKILVHGGGRIATDIASKMNIKPQIHEGRRITNAETLKVVTMVYAGLINKNIVAQLQSLNCNSIGLSGADGNIIPAIKRPVKDIDYGFVGDIDTTKINTKTISSLINAKLIPIICPITHDKKANLLNTNADTIASSIAVALSQEYDVDLIYCFEKKGVLINENNKTVVIKNLNKKSYQKYKQKGDITDGMIPKLDNAFQSLEKAVKSVTIKHAKDLNNSEGTHIQL